MRKSKIGLAVFEIRGKTRKKLFEYSMNPNTSDIGIKTLNEKFGMNIRSHSESIAKKMRY